MIQLKMGKLDEAAREFESELALNPSDVEANITSVSSRWHARKPSEASD